MATDRTDKIYWHSSELMPEIQSNSATLVIASPPYTNNPDGKTLDKKDYLDFLQRVYGECERVLKPGGVLVSINTDLRDHAKENRGDHSYNGQVWHKHSAIRAVSEASGLHCIDTKIWAKKLGRDIYRYTFSYIQLMQKRQPGKPLGLPLPEQPEFAPDVWLLEGGCRRKDSTGLVFHDAIHPQIPARCIQQLTKPGELVVSPFVGSGTIPTVAKLLGRVCIGYEINKKLENLIDESVAHPENFEAYDGIGR